MNVPLAAAPVWRFLHNRKPQLLMDTERIWPAQKGQKDFFYTETPPQAEDQAHRPPVTSHKLLSGLPSSLGAVAHQGAP